MYKVKIIEKRIAEFEVDGEDYPEDWTLDQIREYELDSYYESSIEHNFKTTSISAEVEVKK